MKNFIITLIFIFALGNIFGQSITLTPNAAANSEVVKLKKSGVGLDHGDNTGIVRVGTYVNGLYAFIQTHSNHALNFTTNNGSSQMILTTTGNLGIGNITPNEKLEVTGNIRSSNLAGTGTRSVSADADGTLTTASPSPQTYYVSLPPSAFVEAFNYASTRQVTDAVYYFIDANFSRTLYCPIILPHGATLTNVKINYYDLSANTLTFSLLASSFDGTNPSTISLGSSTNSINGNTSTALTQAIDNSTSGYTLKVNFVSDNSNIRLHGAILTYTK